MPTGAPTGSTGSTGPTGPTSGEALLRSPELDRAAQQIAQEVEAQVGAALQGPVGTALAAGAASSGSGPSGGTSEHQAAAQALLRHTVPRTFIAVGAALTTAFAAVGAGDELRAAGGLRCAQSLLFPADPLGQAAVSAAARPALEALAPDHAADATAAADVSAAMERRVAREVEALDRAYLQVSPHLRAAALGAYSWKHASGGAGPE
ncbi:MAG TPA: hypothetical protein VFX49_09270, partial [Chloroflexota bacterium]|nr:hypothetical protein [Chloroflexota bacterium]